MDEQTLWVCGKYLGQLADRGSAWELQGVFDTQKKAIEACDTPTDFIGPVKLNVPLPQETVGWAGCYYPLKESSTSS